MSGKKKFNSTDTGKTFLHKLNRPYPPPPQKSHGQPHTSKCHPSTKWLARVHHVVVFKTKVLHFKIENTPIKDTNGKRKFKRMLSFLFASLPRSHFLDVTQRSPKSSRSFGGALRDIQKRLRGRLPFCGQTRTFRYEIVFRGIQPCFLHSGSERLACFEPTEAARFLKKLEVHSVLDGQGEVRF